MSEFSEHENEEPREEISQELEQTKTEMPEDFVEEGKKQEKIKRILQWVKDRQPAEYKNLLRDEQLEFFGGIGRTFLNDLLLQSTGYCDLSY